MPTTSESNKALEWDCPGCNVTEETDEGLLTVSNTITFAGSVSFNGSRVIKNVRPSDAQDTILLTSCLVPLTSANSDMYSWFQLLCEVHLINQTADGVETNPVYVSLQFVNVLITEATTTSPTAPSTTVRTSSTAAMTARNVIKCSAKISPVTSMKTFLLLKITTVLVGARYFQRRRSTLILEIRSMRLSPIAVPL